MPVNCYRVFIPTKKRYVRTYINTYIYERGEDVEDDDDDDYDEEDESVLYSVLGYKRSRARGAVLLASEPASFEFFPPTPLESVSRVVCVVCHEFCAVNG